MKKIRIYFDFYCPYCYHEWANLRLLEKEGITCEREWYAWEIRPDLQGQPAVPWEFTPEQHETFGQLGEKAGVTATTAKLRAASHDALRLHEAAVAQGLGEQWLDRVFRGVYQEGGDMSDHNTLLQWAADIGLAEADKVLAGDRYADILLAHDAHCMEIKLEHIPSLEEDGKLLASGVLTYEHTREILLDL